MRSYEASSLIEAAPDRVWTTLTDAASWPDWESGVTNVDGRVALGEKLVVAVVANPGRTFPVKVTALEAPWRMVCVAACRWVCSPARERTR